MEKIGNKVKVFLEGESPWGIVTEVIDATHIKARIINHLKNTRKHGISYGNIVSFKLQEVVKGHPTWEYQPAPLQHYNS